jgi:nicotinate phosphoribosyltransferase
MSAPAPPEPPLPQRPAEQSALLLDLYELTMLETYFRHGMDAPATFELFVRRLPRGRNFLVAAGLEQALDFLESFRLNDAELAYLARSGRFGAAFLDRLESLRFTGEVHAVPEGTILFAQEPLLRVTAPLPEAQIVETRLINLLQLQTMVASKASRMVLAAAGRLLVDFGLRRAHGAEAGLLSARAAYIAGLAGTSNVLAGARFGIPVFGTMAHSFVQAHDDERVAFERFALAHPDNAVMLLDTYDTEAAARKVVVLARALTSRGARVQAVRIDSGDLAAHARQVRRILDEGGLPEVRILASSALDEERIEALVSSGAPIDGFAPGTYLVTSADAPYLDCAYKLVAYDGRPRWKTSEGKALWPGAKQVRRVLDAQGLIERDTLTLADESGPGEPLLRLVMRAGRRLRGSPDLVSVREYAAAQRLTLPHRLRALAAADPPPVAISLGIRKILSSN